MLNFLFILLRIKSNNSSGPFVFYLSILGFIGIVSLIAIILFKWKDFLLLMLIIKPFIDITVNAPLLGLGGTDFNALELSALIIFLVALVKYASITRKSKIFNHSFIWLFIVLQLISYLLSISDGHQSLIYGVKFFLRLLGGYFIYFIAVDTIDSLEKQLKLFKVIWITSLIAGVITIFIYYSGFSNFDATKGQTRFNGLYNDPGTPSYLSVICLLFGILYKELSKDNFSTFLKWVYYFSWFVTLFIMAITLTKSALLMFVVFIIMYFGVHRKKLFLVIPLLFLGIYLSFSTFDALNERFQDEINYAQDNSDEDIRSLGTGRVNRWSNLLDFFENELDLPSQLIGTSSQFQAHNQYMAYLMQVGIIGLLVFLFILLRFFIRLHQMNRSPQVSAAKTLLIMYCVYALTGCPFNYTTLLWYLMILLALINVKPIKKNHLIRDQKSILNIKPILITS
jgi:hypothetical protein